MRVGGFFNGADFRRIYGVFFCILLYREATEYLLFAGTARNVDNNFCSKIIVPVCDPLISNHAQTHGHDAKDKAQESYYAHLGFAQPNYYFFKLLLQVISQRIDHKLIKQ